MSDMNKCHHCGTFVPAEKAFCPNCSEPMEPEEAPNRAHSFSSDMMSTIRDDPEKYRDLLVPPVKNKQAAQAKAQPPQPPPSPVTAPPPVPTYSVPDAMYDRGPTAKSNKGLFLILGASLVVILVVLIVILLVLK